MCTQSLHKKSSRFLVIVFSSKYAASSISAYNPNGALSAIGVWYNDDEMCTYTCNYVCVPRPVLPWMLEGLDCGNSLWKTVPLSDARGKEGVPVDANRSIP